MKASDLLSISDRATEYILTPQPSEVNIIRYQEGINETPWNKSWKYHEQPFLIAFGGCLLHSKEFHLTREKMKQRFRVSEVCYHNWHIHKDIPHTLLNIITSGIGWQAAKLPRFLIMFCVKWKAWNPQDLFSTLDLLMPASSSSLTSTDYLRC